MRRIKQIPPEKCEKYEKMVTKPKYSTGRGYPVPEVKSLIKKISKPL
jgi:hypothetical protein